MSGPVDAQTIAVLVRSSTTSIEDAAKLIESFANVAASEARRQAFEESHAQHMAIVDRVFGEKP